jgi:hypothetical protein
MTDRIPSTHLVPCWLLAALLAGSTAAVSAAEVAVTVRAPGRDTAWAIVTADVPAASGWGRVTVWRGTTAVPAQLRREGARAYVTWIARDLKQGEAGRYRIAFEPPARGGPAPAKGIRVERRGDNLEIRVDGELFTRYDTTTGPNKPYFYPIVMPGGRALTRGYPIEPATGESRDHPHHRGLWITHGAVNGADFWLEGARAATTVHKRYEQIESGPVYGGFRATTDWIGADGRKICEDTREVRVYAVGETRLIDLTVTFHATNGPVTFGDTKEGFLGLRVADTMRVKGGRGHIETSADTKDAAAWGKRAAWVDYYGPVRDATLGVAIFDHPRNLRHPTWWHVRDYGLFAANPFGIHDFEPQQPAGAGSHTIPSGGELTFRYRLYLHPGSTAEARVADAWAAYAEPPVVTVLRATNDQRPTTDDQRRHSGSGARPGLGAGRQRRPPASVGRWSLVVGRERARGTGAQRHGR